MAQLLREAIDDMRLAIDTLAPGREGLLEALGNLRYRLEPRFRAAGTELRFALHDLPDRLDVPPDAALQILRILQEALTNALKHARPKAVEVDVSIQHDGRRFAFAVRDDGTGFEPDVAAAGRGLAGMRRRAQAIGAALEIVSGRSGTRVALSYPILAPR
jgi:signal transduction histidine kinase